MMEKSAPPTPPESPARARRWRGVALTLAALAVVLAGTALALTVTWLNRYAPDGPITVPSASSSGPASTAAPAVAQQAFTAAMYDCQIAQGAGAAVAPADGTAAAALAVRVPRVLDNAGLTTEQFSCLAGHLDIPTSIVDKMLIRGQESGDQVWTMESGTPLAVTWTRGLAGLSAVIVEREVQS